jgi:hypothetical protein
MKIYLAAKYSRNPEMRVLRDHLGKDRRHAVISRWIEGNHEISEANGDWDRSRFAQEDLEDLHNSDVVLWFAEPEKIEGRNRGGRHVEFGLALAWGIPIIVIGRKENVFHWLPEVRHVGDFASALRVLGVAETEVSA